MQRRSLLKLGVASAAVLAVAGGGAAMMRPGLIDGRLSDGGRAVLRAAGAAILDGSLPASDPARAAAVDGMLDRVDALTSALPPHSQKELSLLLSLLASAPGRHAIAGLTTSWQAAQVGQMQTALEGMRKIGRAHV